MAQGLAWLLLRNAERAADRAARGAATRTKRFGSGRAMARAAWSARRAAKRRAARRRFELVGRVRMVGKGPYPRPGPRLPKGVAKRDAAASSPEGSIIATPACSPASLPQTVCEPECVESPEPMDDEMFAFIDEHMRDCDERDFARQRQCMRRYTSERLASLARSAGVRRHGWGQACDNRSK